MVWHGDNLPWAQRMRCIQLAYSHRWCHIVGVPMLLWVVLLEKPTPLPISLENQPHWLCKCICQLFQSRRLLLNLAKYQQPLEQMTETGKKSKFLSIIHCAEHIFKGMTIMIIDLLYHLAHESRECLAVDWKPHHSTMRYLHHYRLPLISVDFWTLVHLKKKMHINGQNSIWAQPEWRLTWKQHLQLISSASLSSLLPTALCTSHLTIPSCSFRVIFGITCKWIPKKPENQVKLKISI